MSRGIPIITTDVGANMEMLEEKGGIIVPPKSIEALNSAIKTAKNQKKREFMSAWNIKKVLNSYCISKVFLEIRKKYEELLYENNQ